MRERIQKRFKGYSCDDGETQRTIRRVYEELEKEGFVSSQVGIGTSVTASNLELLRDSKRRLVEAKMLDMIQIAKTLKISKEELNEMMNILYEED